jgi:hypothetical protein
MKDNDGRCLQKADQAEVIESRTGFVYFGAINLGQHGRRLSEIAVDHEV